MAPDAPSLNDVGSDSQEKLVAVLVLLILFIFFLAYCCWGTSFCRIFISTLYCCRKGNAVTSEINDGDGGEQRIAPPTIILLPYGRVLVVDGTVFTQFHAENSGLDLLELGENVFQMNGSQRIISSRIASSPSFSELSSDENDKDLISSTTVSLPPSYESIFGDCQALCMPPSYSEAFRNCLAENFLTDERFNDESNSETFV